MCVGLVATRLGFPRGLAVIGSDVYVADLASRTPGRGRILRLANFGRGAPEVVLSGLNQPNGLAAGRGGKLYVGEVGRIIRFDPRAADPRATISVVMTGLPKDGRHDLTAFILAPDGGMVVNVGSFSDNCESESGTRAEPGGALPGTGATPAARRPVADPTRRAAADRGGGCRGAGDRAAQRDGARLSARTAR